MKVHFVTPSRISLINLTTIGDSEKREDPTKIGQFSSGQAYCTALLLRDGVKFNIGVYNTENSKELISYSTTNKVCESTGKSKEIIVLHHQEEGCSEQKIETAFALNLGYNWEIWMALRELWSNMLDEGGYVIEGELEEAVDYGTVMTLEFDESNEFYGVWKNKHLYINLSEPLFKLGWNVQALENKEGFLRIYKNNILVYKDEEVLSKYAWNMHQCEIDERRVLLNISSVKGDIVSSISQTENESFLKTIISNDFKISKEDFLYVGSLYYSSVSETVNRIASEVYAEFGNVETYDWLLTKIKERPDSKVGTKIIQTIEDSLWGYSTKVHIESAPKEIEEKEFSFKDEVKKIFNFEVDVDVKTAKLKGSKVVADRFENCLVISEDFDIENDFNLFIVEYLTLKEKGNIVANLSNYICKLIKK